MKPNHMYTLEYIKLRKQELNGIVNAEKQEMSKLAMSIQESLKPNNLLKTFLNDFSSDDGHKVPLDDTFGSIIGNFTNKNSKYLRIAILIAPYLFKIIKLFKKKRK